MSFVHLKTHTMYSLLTSCLRIDAALDRCKEYEMPALAMTDSGNLFGAAEFFQKATKKGIKPIIGMDAYLASQSRHNRKRQEEQTFRLTLLAKDNEGYRNLLKLSTIGYMEGFYYRPRIDLEVLEKHREGLIILSGFARSALGLYTLSHEDERAEEYLQNLLNIFPKEDVYLELQRHAVPERDIIIERFKEFSQKYDIKTVATNDVHYLNQEDNQAHEVLLCLQSGKTLDDDKRMRFPSQEFYLKSPEQMAELFQDVPEAISNTLDVAERCNVEIDFSKRYLPHFEIPTGQPKEEYLRKLCMDSMEKLYPGYGEKELERLDFELKTINEMGFADYFLIVSDFVIHAKNQGIPVGPGRGSAAGSIVSYLMGITTLDPLKYNLLFERFLNPARISMPDIDIDFCKDKRADVIAYVTEKYGRENVAQIITYGTMAAKMSVRDVGRVLNVPLSDVDRLAKFIPPDPKVKLKKALEEVEDLKKAYDSTPEYKRLFDIALQIEGLVRQPGIHAAGIIISGVPLTEMTPLYKGGEEVTTQYEACWLEELGLLKMDFLGLKTLTILRAATDLIKHGHGKEIDLETIALDDTATYDLLSAGKTVGVFQLESDGMRNLARSMGVDCFEVIVALLALYRPGPLDWAPDFIECKKGRREIEYAHPLMEPILKETFGIMLYQEQVMQVVSELAGFSLAEADLLRRAMGKKKEDVMAAQREKFVEGCAKKHDIAADLANKIFDNIYKFAGYGFNKSHSAAYSLISYQTAYLKANYPVEYMAGLLTNWMDNTDKVVVYIEECKQMNISILPPDVNSSYSTFTVVEGGIRFGLSAIKNVGGGAIDSVIEVREKGGPFASLSDFCARVDLRQVNKRVLESLIKAGAMDSFGSKRSQMFASLDQVMDMAQKDQKDQQKGQASLFDMLSEEDKQEVSLQEMPELDEWSESERLAMEKESVGFYVTGHPLGEHEATLQLYATRTSTGLAELIEQLQETANGAKTFGQRDEGLPVRVGGLILDVRTILTRKGDKMAFVKLEDLEGIMDITVFPKTYETYREFLEKDAPVFIEGKASLSRRGDEVQVLAGKIVKLDSVAGMYTDVLQLKVQSQFANEETLGKLDTIFAEHHGDCSVHLILCLSDKETVKVEVGEKYWVNPSPQLKKALEDICGSDTVMLGNEGQKVAA